MEAGVTLVVARFIREFWPVMAAAAGASLLAAVGVLPRGEGMTFFYSWAGVVYLLGVVLTVTGAFATYVRERRVAALRRRLEDSEEALQRAGRDYFAQLHLELARLLGEVLGLGDTERISLYRPRDGRFQLMGRYSPNPELESPPMRPFYPAEGVIGLAWREGRAFEAGLPDPVEERERYLAELERRWGVEQMTAGAMTVWSRVLAAAAICEPRGFERVAVIVVESTDMGTIDEKEFYAAVEGAAGERIYDFLERGRAFEPEPGYAARQSF